MTDDLRIRLATVLDAEAIVAMKDAAWRESYGSLVSASVLDGLDARRDATVAYVSGLMQEGYHFWVATRGDEIVGVALAGPRRDADVSVLLELELLYVRESVKGSGLADGLLSTAIGDADAYLWVMDGNERAIAFYRRHGFVPDGARRPIDDGLPDEIRMVRVDED